MDDLFAVNVVHGSHDLFEKGACLVLLQVGVLFDVAAQLPPSSEFHNETNRVRMICNVQYPNDVRVPQIPKGLYFLKNSLQVRELAEALFRDKLHRSSLPGFNVDAFHHTAETSLAQFLMKDKIAHHHSACTTVCHLERFSTGDMDDLTLIHLVHISTLHAIRMEGLQRGSRQVQCLRALLQEIRDLRIGRQKHLAKCIRRAISSYEDLHDVMVAEIHTKAIQGSEHGEAWLILFLALGGLS
mmetsp:Transcript_2275/g.5372  ORF Transcript_2275/g.5372 Transcript_2275/m.5372 type:complete len:242 (+) Transcript_2275:745-1470(+)